MFTSKKLTCNVEFGRRDLVLYFALVEAFVFAGDVCYTKFAFLAVLNTEVFWVVDVYRLQRTKQSRSCICLF